MTNGWYRVRGAASPLGYRYYGLSLGPGASGTLNTTVCSGDQIYLVPWYTGPGGAIDQLVCYFNSTASVAAHMGLYAANHVRYITTGGQLLATSVTAGALTTTASINYTAPANALVWIAVQFPESRTLNTPSGDNAIATLGWETNSFDQAYFGLVCSYAYTSGLPATLAIAGVARTGPTNPPPFLGVHYA